MRRFLSYGVALLIVLLIAGWLATGTLIQGGQGEGEGETAIVDVVEDSEDGPLHGLFEALGWTDPVEDETDVADAETAAEPEIEEASLLSVRTETFAPQAKSIELELRGRTQANAIITARAETSGIVEEVMVKKGDTVAAGDMLCQLDRGTREARVSQARASVAQAEAALAQAEADLENNITLRERGIVPANTARQFEVALRAAEAQLQAAQSGLDDAEAELERTAIIAEVAGLIQDPVANVGDMASTGGECATIVQLNPIVFSGNVAEAHVGALREGMAAMITTVNGDEVQGIVTYIASRADAATRSFPVEIEAENPGSLRSGITAGAVIRLGEIPAHFVPQSVLTLDSDGTIGVKVVEGDTAVFRPVTIIGDETDGVWISGLTGTAHIITFGQEYAVDGEKVAATDVSESAA